MRAEKPENTQAHYLPVAHRGTQCFDRGAQEFKLPIEDIEAPGRLFWRFETVDNVSVGFGGLEVYDGDALFQDAR